MSSRPRIGVVGLGGMGTVHARNLAEAGAAVVGADVAPETRRRFAEELDTDAYAGYRELYDEADPDAVVVATPNAHHEAPAVAALAEDRHVLIEKPLADDLAGAERVAAAARDSEGFCTVGFHNRYAPAASIFASYRDEGRFGDITHVEATYLRRRGIPSVGSWFTDRELSGGGALIDIGVHVLDLALYALDFPEITEVSGVTRSAFGGRGDYADPEKFGGDGDGDTFDVEDSVTALLRCADGRTISLDVSWATNREPAEELVVRGTEAGARLRLGGHRLEINEAGTGGGDHYATTRIEGDADADTYALEAEDFCAAVGADEAPELNSVEQGLAVQRVIDAIYRSAERGTAVSLAERRDRPEARGTP